MVKIIIAKKTIKNATISLIEKPLSHKPCCLVKTNIVSACQHITHETKTVNKSGTKSQSKRLVLNASIFTNTKLTKHK